jgi:predicted ATPase
MPGSAPDPGFILDRARGEAHFGGVRLDLDAAAFALLQALLDADGAVLDAAILARQDGAGRLWASVARLNDALGRCSPLAGHVTNHPGQGYQLVRTRARGNRLLGRADELARVAELLQAQRFVTIAGPGGIGKTTLARAVAAHCADLYPDGVRFIDLAALAEGRELAGALGAALGIARLTREGLVRLGAFLRGRRMLIVFDCCEHHTAVAAQACEALLRAACGVDILCTSREPLLAQSERIVRLGPIGVPDAGGAEDAAAAVRYPAVQLFVAQAQFDNPAGFVLDDRNAAMICTVCRSVEGVPLALELAASLVRSLGLHALALQTSKWLLEPPGGPAQAGGRHRTLSSMLDWSYDVLAPHEQQVLRALAVFRGGFTLEAAGAVAACATLDPDGVLDIVIELAGKSLVSMGGEGDAYRPRLLDLTREYAFDKLAASGGLHAVQAHHAHWLCTLADRLDGDWMTLSRQAWLALYGPWVDDFLSAIDWALGPGREPLLGARLAGIGFSLGDQVGLAREFHERVQRALEAIARMADVPAPVRLRLNFVSADGPGLSAMGLLRLMGKAEWVVKLARDSGSPMLQGASLIAIWGYPYVRGDYPNSLASAQRIAQAARAGADPYLELIGQRTMAQSLHYMGRHAEAHRCAALALSNADLRIPLAYQPSPVQVGTSVRIVLARLLWMEGAADRALAMSEEALVLSESDRPSAMCQVLATAAVPVALWRGDTAHAAGLVRRLRERAEGHGMGFWIEWAQRFEDALAVIEGAADPRSLPSFDDRHDFFAKCRDHLVTFSTRLLSDEAIMRCETGLVAWCLPELLRAQAVRCLAADALDGDGAAAKLLRRAMAVARGQGAPAWSLRSATSLASLYQRQGAQAQARAALEPVLAGCREGQATADLRAAHALMRTLG